MTNSSPLAQGGPRCCTGRPAPHPGQTRTVGHPAGTPKPTPNLQATHKHLRGGPICTVGARSFLTDKRLARMLGSPSSGPPEKPRRDGGTDSPVSFKTESQSPASDTPFWNGLCKVWCPWRISLERWPNGTQQLNLPTVSPTCHKAHKKVGTEVGLALPPQPQPRPRRRKRHGREAVPLRSQHAAFRNKAEILRCGWLSWRKRTTKVSQNMDR